MDNFEELLKESCKKEEAIKIDPLTQQKITEVYQGIRQKARRKRLWKRILLAAGIVLVVGAGFMQTTPGAAALEYIQMKVFPQSLEAKNFVKNENLTATDQDITVTLERMYADELEIGFTLAIDYSKNQKLMAKEDWAEEFWPRMKIQTSAGEVLDKGVMGGRQYLDRDNHRMAYSFTLSANSYGGFQNLTGITISIDEIKGIEKIDKSKPGLHNFEVLPIAGNWEFEVLQKDFKEFSGKNYQASQSPLPIAKAVAYPSGFAIEYEDSQKLQEIMVARNKAGLDNESCLRVEKDGKTTYY